MRKEFIFYFFPSPVGSNRNVGTSNGSTFFSAETNFWKIQFSFFFAREREKNDEQKFRTKKVSQENLKKLGGERGTVQLTEQAA